MGLSACGSSPKPSDSSSQPPTSSQPSGEDTAEKPTADAKTARVFGFSPPTMNNPFFLWIEEHVREVVEGNGDTLITADPQLDTQKQISQIEDMLTQNIDVLLLCPFDSTSIKTALVAANEAGVPVIIFDTPVVNPELVATTVASDNFNAGYVVGKDMMTNLEEGSEIAVIYSPAGETDRKRIGGFNAAVGDYFNIVAQMDGKGDTGVTLPIAEDILQAHPNLKGFFCCNDPSAIGAVQAVAAAGIKSGDIVIYGVDGAPEAKAAIISGEMYGTGAQSPTNIAKLAVQAAYDYLDGKELKENTVVDTFIINKDNVNDFGVEGFQ